MLLCLCNALCNALCCMWICLLCSSEAVDCTYRSSSGMVNAFSLQHRVHPGISLTGFLRPVSESLRNTQLPQRTLTSDLLS